MNLYGIIDAILLGPDDLASSMGYRGHADDPHVEEAIWRVTAACRDSGLAIGQAMMDAAGVNLRLEHGFRFLTLSSDYLILARGYKQDLETVRR